MIRVFVVPQKTVQKTVVAQLNNATNAACLTFNLDAQELHKSVKKGVRVVVVGQSKDSDVRVSLENLSSMGITIQQVMQSMDAPRFLVIEGFALLTLRLSPVMVRRFALFLTASLRSWGVDTVFIVAKEANAGSVLPVLMQAADEVISGKGQ